MDLHKWKTNVEYLLNIQIISFNSLNCNLCSVWIELPYPVAAKINMPFEKKELKFVESVKKIIKERLQNRIDCFKTNIKLAEKQMDDLYKSGESIV